MVDVDGTLVDRDERLAADTAEALEILAAQGRMLSIASGRAAISVLGFASMLGVRVPVIAHNGSVILAPDGRVLYENLLTRPMVEAVLGLVPKEIAVFGVFKDHVVYAEEPDERIKLLRAWGHRDYVRRPGWHDAPPDGMPMLHFIGPREAVEAVAVDLRAVDDVTPRVYPSGRGPWFHLEVRRGIDDKGSALRWLLDHLGLGPSEVLAAGDWLNDISMFQAAGFSMAMPESLPEVRAAATHVAPVPATDGGLGRFLKGFFDLA